MSYPSFELFGIILSSCVLLGGPVWALLDRTGIAVGRYATAKVTTVCRTCGREGSVFLRRRWFQHDDWMEDGYLNSFACYTLPSLNPREFTL